MRVSTVTPVEWSCWTVNGVLECIFLPGSHVACISSGFFSLLCILNGEHLATESSTSSLAYLGKI